mmetsp:Transcript_24817/g.78736  ORF Transcript_24817/g.78736 Transcript_24817/m.78736 type:complete len:210 (-) Transcript_24817:62-691(-)
MPERWELTRPAMSKQRESRTSSLCSSAPITNIARWLHARNALLNTATGPLGDTSGIRSTCRGSGESTARAERGRAAGAAGDGRPQQVAPQRPPLPQRRRPPRPPRLPTPPRSSRLARGLLLHRSWRRRRPLRRSSTPQRALPPRAARPPGAAPALRPPGRRVRSPTTSWTATPWTAATSSTSCCRRSWRRRSGSSCDSVVERQLMRQGP